MQTAASATAACKGSNLVETPKAKYVGDGEALCKKVTFEQPRYLRLAGDSHFSAGSRISVSFQEANPVRSNTNPARGSPGSCAWRLP